MAAGGLAALLLITLPADRRAVEDGLTLCAPVPIRESWKKPTHSQPQSGPAPATCRHWAVNQQMEDECVCVRVSLSLLSVIVPNKYIFFKKKQLYKETACLGTYHTMQGTSNQFVFYP